MKTLKNITLSAVVALLAVTPTLLTSQEMDHSTMQHEATADTTIAEKYTCPMHEYVKLSKPGECPICGMDLVPASSLEKEAAADSVSSDSSEHAIYSCPMHPEVVQNEPGKCPKCGMNLTPVDSQDEHESENMDHEHMMEHGE